MTRIRMLCAGVAMAAGVAYGQAAEASLSVGRSIFTDKTIGDLGVQGSVQETLKLGDGLRISARFSINNWRFLGHEFGYGYDRSALDFGSAGKSGMSIHQGFYDFMAYATPEGSFIRPFVCAGGGFSSFFPPGTSAFSGNGFTKFGYNYGGGVKVKLSPIYGLRFDVRDYVSGKPFGDFIPNVRGKLHNIEVSAGIAILF
jgi:outer membrane protein with beta-barrel domain